MFLRLIETSEHRRKRAEYADRGAGEPMTPEVLPPFMLLTVSSISTI